MNILEFIDNLPDGVRKYKTFTTDILIDCSDYFKKYNKVDELSEIDINSDENLLKLYNFETNGRGFVIGKGELLIVFLINGANFNKGTTDLIINGKEYEVKAYKTNTKQISLGVKNIVTSSKYGRRIITLFDKIDDNREKLRGSYWLRKHKSNIKSNWTNRPIIEKLSALEIGKKDFENISKEIPKLKGKINHPYVDDIKNMEDDIERFNKEFNDRSEKMIIFINNNIKVFDKMRMSTITQSKFKMCKY